MTATRKGHYYWPTHPVERLRYHVTGAIERGEAEPIIEQTKRLTMKGYNREKEKSSSSKSSEG